MKRQVITLVALAFATLITHAAMDTAFTYQGRLNTPHGPANGTHDFEFSLWDKDTAGHLLGTNTLDDHWVSNGLFTVELDFGANVFNGEPRWLEIYVKNSASTNGLVQLTPRVRLTAAPFSFVAGAVVDGSITGTKISDNAISSGKILDGAVVASKLATNSVGTATLMDGSVTTAKLADAAVTSQKLSNGVVTSTHIAPGAVGASQLAAGSVNSAKIADGSILSVDIAVGGIQGSNIANGAVGAAQLARRYAAGRIEGSTLGQGFGTLGFNVSFNPPFSKTPVLWTDPASGGDFVISNKSASGFSGAIVGMNGAVTETLPQGESPVAINGHGAPALARAKVHSYIYDQGSSQNGSWNIISYSNSVLFTRSTNMSGFGAGTTKVCFASGPYFITNSYQQVVFESHTYRWGTISNKVQAVSAAMIGGYPAVAWSETTEKWNGGDVEAGAQADYGPGRLRYMRALDTNGNVWPAAPTTLLVAIKYARQLVLTEVNGRPAIFYHDKTNSAVRYVRASDAAGNSWPVSPTTVASIPEGILSSAAFIAGRPAATFLDTTTDQLKFIRANDADGTTWASPSLIASSVTLSFNAENYHLPPICALAEINGRPAVAFSSHTAPAGRYMRCGNTEGTNWAAAATTTFGGFSSERVSLILLGGKPAIGFNGNSDSAGYVAAMDIDGTQWGSQVLVATQVGSSQLHEARGAAAIVTFDRDTLDTRYITPNQSQLTIDWFAIEP